MGLKVTLVISSFECCSFCSQCLPFKGGVAIITTDLTTMVYLLWLFVSEEKNEFMATLQLTFETCVRLS